MDQHHNPSFVLVVQGYNCVIHFGSLVEEEGESVSKVSAD